MSPRLLAPCLAVAAVMALLGCGDTGDERGTRATTTQNAGDALAGLKQQANELLDGGPAGFRARLAQLRGTPVVVNQWASWCGPCRYEFPFFQRLARKYDGRVAFLGVNAKDNRDEAKQFLEEYPVPFPHYVDDDLAVSRVFRGGRAFPTTAFYDADGKLTFTHAGSFPSEAKLDAEIREYALDG